MPNAKTPSRSKDHLDEFFQVNLKERIQSETSFLHRDVVSRSENTFDVAERIIQDLYAAAIVLSYMKARRIRMDRIPPTPPGTTNAQYTEDFSLEITASADLRSMFIPILKKWECLVTLADQVDPTISVLMCARNEEQYIEPSLNSLVTQRLDSRFEIVVIDNNSSDRTRDLATAFTQHVHVSEPKGKVPSLKAGLNFVSGTIIALADADTIYPSNWLSLIDSLFRASPETQLVFGPSDMGLHRRTAKRCAAWLSSILFVPSLWLGVVCSMGFNLAIRRPAFRIVMQDFAPFAFSGWGIGTATLRLFGRKSVRYCQALQVPKRMRRYRQEGFVRVSTKWCGEWLRLASNRQLTIMESEYYR